MRSSVLLAASLLVASASPAPCQDLDIEVLTAVEGLRLPRRVRWSPARQAFLVVNGGGPLHGGAPGHLSLVHLEGRREQLPSAEPLTSPADALEVGPVTWVATPDRLLALGPGGSVITRIQVPGARRLYALASAGDGALLAGDLRAGTVFRVDPGSGVAAPFLSDLGRVVDLAPAGEGWLLSRVQVETGETVIEQVEASGERRELLREKGLGRARLTPTPWGTWLLVDARDGALLSLAPDGTTRRLLRGSGADQVGLHPGPPARLLLVGSYTGRGAQVAAPGLSGSTPGSVLQSAFQSAGTTGPAGPREQ